MPIWIQRTLLGLLFIVIASLQLRFSIATVALVSDGSDVPRPPAQIDPDTMALKGLDKILKDAGAQENDVLLAEDDIPVPSFAEASRLFLRHKPGEIFGITLRRGGSQPFQVRVKLEGRARRTGMDILIPVAINIVTPWLCILLGFLVAFRRAGDPVAYALLALLLSESQLLKAESSIRWGWAPFFTSTFAFFDNFSQRGLLVAWAWFAIQFPDPKSRYRLLPRVGWAVGALYLAYGFVEALSSTLSLHGNHSLNALYRVIDLPNWAESLISSVLIALGFANFAYKLAKETRPDLRRRLRWMLVGLTLGFLPVMLLFSWAGLIGRDMNSLPAAVLMPIVLSPFFIPLTLGYAVLVDRLFDVGMFVRQGLLASNLVTVVRAVLIVTLASVMIGVISKKESDSFWKWGEIAACSAAIFGVRRGSVSLRSWVDRHYFQEAVNAEQILTELSAEVRRITDPQLLLRTVTERVASALHVSRVAFAPAGMAFPFAESVVTRLRTERQPLTVQDELLLPITTGDDLHGILSLGPKRSEEPYSGGDLRLLESVAHQTALALENSRLTTAVADAAAHRERITSELEIARKVQERLFPKAAPKVDGLELAGCCKPAQTVGGDYFDFLATPAGSMGLAIGDVAGKGVPAALLMAGLQASLRGLMMAGLREPADLMNKLNVLVYDASPANRFATFLFGLYDPASRVLRYSSAGHNPGLVYRPSETRAIWLKTPGVALGLRRTSNYAQAEIELASGDVLVFYTDGISEARDPAGEEFGDDRLVYTVAGRCGESAGAILDSLIAATEGFAGAAPQHDDITVIVGRVA